MFGIGTRWISRSKNSSQSLFFKGKSRTLEFYDNLSKSFSVNLISIFIEVASFHVFIEVVSIYLDNLTQSTGFDLAVYISWSFHGTSLYPINIEKQSIHEQEAMSSIFIVSCTSMSSQFRVFTKAKAWNIYLTILENIHIPRFFFSKSDT